MPVLKTHFGLAETDMHVAGKIQWKAHEKAGQIFRMSRELRMSEGDIATYLRQSKTTVPSARRPRAWTIGDALLSV